MGVARTSLAFLVVVVLTLTLVSGNVVTAADRTVLDEGFVTTTLEEEEAYRTAQPIVAGEAGSRIVEGEDSIPVPVDPERAANETITRGYLKNQTEANVGRTFRFLNGQTDDFELWVVLTPVKENVADFAEDRIRELTVAELIDAVTESRELSIDVEVPESNETVPVDLRVVGNMSEGPEAYRAEREGLVEAFVNATYRGRSPSELLYLIGENPREYNESERERIVRERETEIKSELEPRVKEELSDAPERLRPRVSAAVNESLSEQFQPVGEPATELLMVGVRGLTTDMTYETFDAELSTAKANLADNVSTVVRDVLDEGFPERLDLTADLSQGAETMLDQAREANGLVGLLGVLLPIVAILLIGALYLVTRSVAGTAFGSGVALASAGGAGFLIGEVTPGMVESRAKRGATIGSAAMRTATDGSREQAEGGTRRAGRAVT